VVVTDANGNATATVSGATLPLTVDATTVRRSERRR